MLIPPSKITQETKDNGGDFMARLYGYSLNRNMDNEETIERLVTAVHNRTAVGDSDGS